MAAELMMTVVIGTVKQVVPCFHHLVDSSMMPFPFYEELVHHVWPVVSY